MNTLHNKAINHCFNGRVLSGLYSSAARMIGLAAFVLAEGKGTAMINE
ncbi:hypothetical protein ACNR9V_20420 (plasmid) [Parageobacillus thermoglucosidasius]